MSVNKVEDGLWLVCVRVNGKQVHRRVRGAKHDALDVEAKIKANGVPTDSKMRLGPYLRDTWLPTKTISGNMRSYYERSIRLDMTSPLLNTRLCELSVYQLDAHFAKMPENSTRKRCKTTLAAALHQARIWGLIERNPMDDVTVTIPAKIERLDDTYTAEEVAEIMSEIRGSDIEPWVLLGLYSGLRNEEYMALDWPDIDTKRGVISVYKAWAMVDGKPTMKETKTRASADYVDITGYALERLAELGKDRIGPLVFVRKHRPRPDFFCKAWGRFCRDHGIRYIPPANFRPTCGTLMITSGVPIEDVSHHLRHKRVSTTADMYLRGYADSRRRAVESLDAAIAKPVTEKKKNQTRSKRRA